MLKNFFKLNNEEQIHKYVSFDEFNTALDTSRHLYNVSYWPDDLKNIKIENKIFENVSFSKTSFTDVTLKNCTVKDCLFIGVKFIGGSIHSCNFERCNFFKATFKNTYAKPQQFKNSIIQKEHSNIAVSLFNQLRNLYKEDSQREYKSEAEYYFYKWKRIADYTQAQREGDKWYIYTPKRITSAIYGCFFGYGYRLRNLLITTLISLLGLVSVNHFFSNQIFKLVENQPAIEPSIIKSIYFTITTMVTLGATGFPPLTETGYLIVVIDVLLGVTLLTVTINSVFKRVLK